MINNSLIKCFFKFVKLLGTSRAYDAWTINFYSIRVHNHRKLWCRTWRETALRDFWMFFSHKQVEWKKEREKEERVVWKQALSRNWGNFTTKHSIILISMIGIFNYKFVNFSVDGYERILMEFCWLHKRIWKTGLRLRGSYKTYRLAVSFKFQQKCWNFYYISSSL